MKVKFGKSEYEVTAELADLYVLSNGMVVARKDCKPVEDKPKAEKKTTKKKAE